MFRLPPETAHELGIKALEMGLGGSPPYDGSLSEVFGPIRRFGLKFSNPLGLAAGFDKNGLVVDQLASLGFGFVEVGTVTLHPQPGNPKPRLFRLPDDKALINRLGFNNDGAEAVANRLAKIDRRCVVGVNIGRNKDVDNDQAIENYLQCFDLIHSIADYITVNVSSPNTPNLRDLQKADSLEELLKALQERNALLSGSTTEGQGGPAGPPLKPMLVKIAPDLSEVEIESIVDLCMRINVAGIIATNTTISREGLKTPDVAGIGAGGVSGMPLRNRSTEVISTIYRHSKGKLPIIGVGGIFTAEDAFEKIAAGASLLQAYTGFIYSGPSFAGSINRGLAEILKERKFSSLNEAVGSDHV